MPYSDSTATDLRGAAVAASLTGAVIVLVGYATGLGLTTPPDGAAMTPKAPAAPAAVEGRP